MKKLTLILGLLLLITLPSCYFYETIEVTIWPKKHIVEFHMKNVVSLAEEDKDVKDSNHQMPKADYAKLVLDIMEDSVEFTGDLKNAKALKKKLYEKDDNLNLYLKYKFDTADLYDEDEKGYYIESNEETIAHNGTLITKDDKQYLFWPKGTKKIKITQKMVELDPAQENKEWMKLLPFWKAGKAIKSTTVTQD